MHGARDGTGTEAAAVTGWRSQAARLREQLASVALTPGADLAERSAAALEALGRVLPFDAAWLAVRDPEAHRHTPLAVAGEADALRSYFRTPTADAEVEALGLNRHLPPMLTSEIPLPLPELHAWADHLLPAGFRGGLAAGLFAPGGRHVGFLSLLGEDETRPGPTDRRVVAAITQVLAQGVDRTQQIEETARAVEAADHGVVLTRAGDVVPLPGLPDHRLLSAGSRILSAAAHELARSEGYAGFLAPTDERDGGAERLVRVTVLECAVPALDHLHAAVLLSAAGGTRGLTPLELRVLGLLVEGVTQAPAIATALDIDERTAAGALRMSLLAMRAPNVTAAAVHAVRTGLRIPPQLLDHA